MIRPIQVRRLPLLLGTTGLLLWAATGCNPAQTPGPVPVAQDTSAADVDVAADDADADSNAGDATVDAADAATPTLDPLCVADLPQPSQPCTTKGEIRCANMGATGDQYNLICTRPNYLECTLGADGKLTWVMGACQQYLASTEPTFCQKFASCVIWDGVHRCQPLSIKAETNQPIIGGAGASHFLINACPNSAGQTKCDGDHLDTCTRLGDLPGAVANDIKAQYSKDCGHFLDLGYYWFPVQACPNLSISCACKKPKPPNDCAVPTVYDTKCFIDPATNQPACQKTCHDVGAFGY